MTLREVRAFARSQAIPAALFRQHYGEAFVTAISGLLRAFHREELLDTRIVRNKLTGKSTLHVGREPSLVTPIASGLPFGRLEAVDLPWLECDGATRLLRTTRSFLRVLRTMLSGSEFAKHFTRLAADFDNSFVNLILNRVLAHLNSDGSAAIEPAFRGHFVHPFPALRQGPEVDLVVSCSNLSAKPINLQLVEVRSGDFVSYDFADHSSCTRAWTKRSYDGGGAVVIPVHPWQVALSPVIRHLIELGFCAVSTHSIEAVPLASQRTCRILSSGFDVKLPINATLTGEHRLLYRWNARRAPLISALVAACRERAESSTIDFQYDVASLLHPDPYIGTHLAVIIRKPMPVRANERLIPALNLWSGKCEAHQTLDLSTGARAEDTFVAYCEVLMRGPVEFHARFGLSLEPHIQNVLIRIRDGRPQGIVLRDLDSTIVEADRAPALFREHGFPLPADLADVMPSFGEAGRRLAHSLIHAHLEIVAAHLFRWYGARAEVLEAAVEDTWASLAACSGRTERTYVSDLRTMTRSVKCLLRMRLLDTTRLVFRENLGAGNGI